MDFEHLISLLDMQSCVMSSVALEELKKTKQNSDVIKGYHGLSFEIRNFTRKIQPACQTGSVEFKRCVREGLIKHCC